MVSWWETVKVEPVNALEIWVVNSSQTDFLKALSLMVSHVLPCTCCCPCLLHSRDSGSWPCTLAGLSFPDSRIFPVLSNSQYLQKEFPTLPCTCPSLDVTVRENLLWREVTVIFTERNQSAFSFHSFNLLLPLKSLKQKFTGILKGKMTQVSEPVGPGSELWSLAAPGWEDPSCGAELTAWCRLSCQCHWFTTFPEINPESQPERLQRAHLARSWLHQLDSPGLHPSALHPWILLRPDCWDLGYVCTPGSCFAGKPWPLLPSEMFSFQGCHLTVQSRDQSWYFIWAHKQSR